MDAKTLSSICSRVYREFPEVKGCSPQKQSQAKNTLLIFKGQGVTATGKPIHRVVRVVVNPDGEILKMTTSR